MRAGIFTTTIEEIKDLGVQDTRHFKLAFEKDVDFHFEAGQFVNIMVETPEKLVKRPYSIDSPPHWKGFIDLCWKRVEGGLITNILWNFKAGEKLASQVQPNRARSFRTPGGIPVARRGFVPVQGRNSRLSPGILRKASA